MLQSEILFVGGDAGGSVGALDIAERLQKTPAEIPYSAVTLSELVVSRGPADELGFSRWHTVQSRRQPDIGVERQRRRGKRCHGPVVERYGMAAETLKVLLAQARG